MPPRRRGLSEGDSAAWTAYTRHVAPLPGRTSTASAPAETVAKSKIVEKSNDGMERRDVEPVAPVSMRPIKAGRTRASAGALAVGTQPGGIDRATWQRLRSGKLPTMRTLDLHGMTTQTAFHALVSFVRSAHADQVRVVEVVTGRGSGENGGAIRREFAHWLNLPDIRPLVLGAAHPHALNPGSVRLILRRIR
jgi:DNA-nicking Smr family endonuclease